MLINLSNDVSGQQRRLALGTVQFGLNYGIANQVGQVASEDAKKIIELSRSYGMNMLDTAIAYGDSEQRLGEIGINDWQVISKLPAVPEGCSDVAQWVAQAVDKSLRRLNASSLYGLLLHRPQQLLEKNGDHLYDALLQLKRDGLVQKIGCSIYSPLELDELCKFFSLDIVQAPFNILDRRLIETEWLGRLNKLGTELHVRSVFLQGLLLMKPNDRPAKFSKWSALWASWDRWLETTGQTPLQATLRFALSMPEIEKVVIGVDSPQQLKEIIDAAEGSLPLIPEDLQSSDLDLINPANWAGLA